MDRPDEFDIEFEELKAILAEPEAISEPQPEPEVPEFMIPGEEPALETEEPQQEPETPAEPPKREKKRPSWQKSLLLWLHDLVYLLAALVLISPLLLRVVVVSGTSMNHTLLDGDYLMVLSDSIYREPEYSDIVVISKESFDNGAPIVKRVIATEGQWVNIDFEAGIVYVGDTREDMKPLTEPYTTTLTTMQEGMKFPLQVPEECIFVLGDNRAVSKDSRHPDIGIIHEQEILGKVFFLFLPGTNGTDAFGRPVEDRDWGRLGFVE